MTILASGSIGAAGFQCQTVNTGAVTIGLPLMTRCAINRRENFIVVRMFHGRVGVATYAGISAMSGGGESNLIYEERDRFSGGVGFEEGVIRVAIETEAVLQCRSGRRACVHFRKQNYDERCQNKTLTSKPAHAL